MKNKYEDENWKYFLQFLPEGWKEKAKELGAIKRKRNLDDIEKYLRLILIHTGSGCSLKETSVRAKEGKIGNMTNVALMKFLQRSLIWMNWMCKELLKRRGIKLNKIGELEEYEIRIFDTTRILEQGKTGSEWRIHYSINLLEEMCDEFHITDMKVGETFQNFEIKAKDLIFGDRAYISIAGIKYVLDRQAHFLTRYRNKAFNLYDIEGNKINLLDKISKLKTGVVKEIEIYIGNPEETMIPVRLIAVKKDPKRAERDMKKAKKELLKKQKKVDPETIELHKYIILATSLPKNISGKEITELYRLRWQIENCFKRLKSIMNMGVVPKQDPISAKAWLQAKMLVALLIQVIIDEGRSFSPWGYFF